MRPQRRLAALFLVFALSGFSGLIYESIWTHYLKLFLGHAAYAQSLVLAIFMGGMAIGSSICGRSSVRWKDLLLGYAVTEAVIGLLALAFHDLFTAALRVSYDVIIPSLGQPGTVLAYKLALSAALILPGSILLGMTFPLMTAGVLRAFPERPGRSIAMLYFTNSLGAAAGVLTSGFLLVRALGLPGTIRLAGAVNLALAATVWLLLRGRAPEPAGALANPASVVGDAGGAVQPARAWARLLLAVSLVTGLSSFVYEVSWIRMLSMVLGASTHAFELMLGAFILGLAFGGLWIQRRIDRGGDPVGTLALVQLAMGLLALSTLVVYGRTFGVMQTIVRGLDRSDEGYLLFNLASNGVALAVMLPTTFCAGMTLPLITYALLRAGAGERAIGGVYAANTVGAIAGVFLAVNLGFPFLGVRGSLVAGAALDLGLGVLLLLWPGRPAAGSRRAAGLAAAVALAALAATLGFVRLDDLKMASGVFRQGELLEPEAQRLLFHRDGATATVSLVEDVASGMRSIRTNGKADAAIGMRPGMPPTSDEYTMVLAALVPAMLHPGAGTAAVIGFGSGLSTHTFLSIPSVRSVDTIEIEPTMVEAAAHFRPLVERAYTDPRGHLFFDDAKTFFATTNRSYDVIFSEPSNPWVSGVAGLFSSEFYRLARRHLAAGGIFVQWVQLYEIDVQLVASVLKAMAPEFADFAMFAPNNGDLLIVASADRPLPTRLDDAVLASETFRPIALRLGLLSARDVVARQVGTKAALARWLAAQPAPANSDYAPFLDQNAARARFLGAFAWDLVDFGHVPLPTIDLLGGTLDPGPGVVQASTYSDLASRAAMAATLRDVVAGGALTPAALALPPDLLRRAIRFETLWRQCPPGAEAERLDLSFGLAVSIAPYLSAAESDDLWAHLEGSACWSATSREERGWYALFRAVGARDARAMAASGRGLLGTPAGRAGAPGRYVVAATLLGEIAAGNRPAARELWRAAAVPLLAGSAPELLFQVLAAEAGVASPP